MYQSCASNLIFGYLSSYDLLKFVFYEAIIPGFTQMASRKVNKSTGIKLKYVFIY